MCEHIYPRVLGGEMVLSNLALACSGCNVKKYNHVLAFDRITGEMVSIFHPRKVFWADHFTWQDNDFTEKTADFTDDADISVE